jgi:hypothetical protein
VVSERRSYRVLHTYKKTIITDPIMNYVVPSYILCSMRRYHLFGMSEESLIIHINSIADTRIACWIFMNCVIDLGFFDLAFGPIWETGLGISCPASVASFRAMVTELWDRRLSGIKLLGVNLCALYVSRRVFSMVRKPTVV